MVLEAGLQCIDDGGGQFGPVAAVCEGFVAGPRAPEDFDAFSAVCGGSDGGGEGQEGQ